MGPRTEEFLLADFTVTEIFPVIVHEENRLQNFVLVGIFAIFFFRNSPFHWNLTLEIFGQMVLISKIPNYCVWIFWQSSYAIHSRY